MVYAPGAVADQYFLAICHEGEYKLFRIAPSRVTKAPNVLCRLVVKACTNLDSYCVSARLKHCDYVVFTVKHGFLIVCKSGRENLVRYPLTVYIKNILTINMRGRKLLIGAGENPGMMQIM